MVAMTLFSIVRHTISPQSAERQRISLVFPVITRLVLLLSVALPLLTPGAVAISSSKVYLDSNGYRDILIAVEEGVQEEEELLEKLREAFTKASDYLYKTTR